MNEGFLTLDKAVQLKPYKARAFKKYEIMTPDEIIAGAGGYLIVDTENYLNYFLIAFKDIKTKKRIIFEPPFDPRALSWLLHSYTTIGFNSIKYDLPLIWLSYGMQDLELLKEASNDLINGMWKDQFDSKWNSKIYPTKHVDLIEVVFFQAEDGIRDSEVTGVQTCALPIWSRNGPASMPSSPHTTWKPSTRCVRS